MLKKTAILKPSRRRSSCSDGLVAMSNNTCALAAFAGTMITIALCFNLFVVRDPADPKMNRAVTLRSSAQVKKNIIGEINTNLVVDDSGEKEGSPVVFFSNHTNDFDKGESVDKEKEEEEEDASESDSTSTSSDDNNDAFTSNSSSSNTDEEKSNNDNDKENEKDAGSSSNKISKSRLRFPGPTLNLLGERHSGTNWMTNHLRDCFGHEVDIIKGYSDWKHWFQVEDKRYDRPGAVVVAQFRNVFDWTEAMRFNPYHSPLHFNLEWREFVTKPWAMPRFGKDVAFNNMTAATCPPGLQCFYGRRLKPYQIIPCNEDHVFHVNWNNEERHKVNAFYELKNDGSGEPFDSVLNLRSAKIRNFFRVRDFDNVRSFHVVRYGDQVRNGTAELIKKLELDLNVTAKCNPIQGEPKSLSSYIIPSDFIEYLKQHVDWQTEALVGFEPDHHTS